jgi:hypothetical protein
VSFSFFLSSSSSVTENTVVISLIITACIVDRQWTVRHIHFFFLEWYWLAIFTFVFFLFLMQERLFAQLLVLMRNVFIFVLSLKSFETRREEEKKERKDARNSCWFFYFSFLFFYNALKCPQVFFFFPMKIRNLASRWYQYRKSSLFFKRVMMTYLFVYE